jgi:hypothetical protein
VPDRWKLYDTGAILDPKISGLTQEEADAQAEIQWVTAFDADPRPRLAHVFSGKNHPWGVARVSPIGPEEADAVSLASLRNLFFDIDGSEDEEGAEIISYDPVNLDGGFHGSHLVANLTMEKGEVMTIDQTVLVDQATTKLYALLVSCSNVCYEQNSGDIERVVESWTVRAK